jgi:hypothetical protein
MRCKYVRKMVSSAIKKMEAKTRQDKTVVLNMGIGCEVHLICNFSVCNFTASKNKKKMYTFHL